MNQMMIVGVLNEGLGRCLDAGASETEVRCASEWLRALLRRDWDVRVLDAWRAADTAERRWAMAEAYDYDGPVSGCSCQLAWADGSKDYAGESDDAARHAAALAVFVSLPEPTRREIGECP